MVSSSQRSWGKAVSSRAMWPGAGTCGWIMDCGPHPLSQGGGGGPSGSWEEEGISLPAGRENLELTGGWEEAVLEGQE